MASVLASWLFRSDRGRINAQEFASFPRDERERLYEHWYLELETHLAVRDFMLVENPESLTAFGRRVLSGDPDALLELKEHIEADRPPDKGFLFLMALHLMQQGDYGRAADFASLENHFHPHFIARFVSVDALTRAGRLQELAELSAETGYAEILRGGRMIRISFRLGDYSGMFRHLLIAEYEGLRVSLLVLALLTGGIWAVILLHCYPPVETEHPACDCLIRAGSETGAATLFSPARAPEVPRALVFILPDVASPVFRSSETVLDAFPNFGNGPPASQRAFLQRWRC